MAVGASPAAPYSGRLITFAETQNPRIPYVKDAKGNIYSINSTTNWASTFYLPGATNQVPYIDNNYLRLKNTSVDWMNFSGFDSPGIDSAGNFSRCSVFNAYRSGARDYAFNGS